MTHMIQIILGWHNVDFFGRIGYTHIEYARFFVFGRFRFVFGLIAEKFYLSGDF